MLNHMHKTVLTGLAVLAISIPVLAWSRLPIHHARASSLSFFAEDAYMEPTIRYSSVSGTALFSWQETSLQSFGHVEVKGTNDAGVTHQYEFKIVRVTRTNATSIEAEWDVFKNGKIACAGCRGSVTVSAPGAANPSISGVIYDSPRNYSFSGYIDSGSRLSY